MSQEVTHTHVLADYDNGFVVVVYSKSDVLNWIKTLENIIKDI